VVVATVRIAGYATTQFPVRDWAGVTSRIDSCHGNDRVCSAQQEFGRGRALRAFVGHPGEAVKKATFKTLVESLPCLREWRGVGDRAGSEAEALSLGLEPQG
jgi:hypothetical protein